eukprot:3085779-Rhodomonas_salina.1
MSRLLCADDLTGTDLTGTGPGLGDFKLPRLGDSLLCWKTVEKTLQRGTVLCQTVSLTYKKTRKLAARPPLMRIA